MCGGEESAMSVRASLFLFLCVYVWEGGYVHACVRINRILYINTFIFDFKWFISASAYGNKYVYLQNCYELAKKLTMVIKVNNTQGN